MLVGFGLHQSGTSLGALRKCTGMRMRCTRLKSNNRQEAAIPTSRRIYSHL